MQLTPSQLAEIMPLLEKMQVECDAIESDIGAQSIAFAYMVQLLVTLFRIYCEHRRKDNLTILHIADALSYLEANLDRKVSTKELMGITNMSASTLNRHFQNATGLSPVEFHIQRRIGKACRLIRTSNLTIGEIAEITGFDDGNYFSRQFRKVMGMSPLQYRKNISIFV
jgi:AraC family L-rhamnose operon transcriptional activator RhaR/AraC family L-rhamnose operon regulatory protein RhaS